MSARKQPFAACGKLMPMFMERSRIAEHTNAIGYIRRAYTTFSSPN